MLVYRDIRIGVYRKWGPRGLEPPHNYFQGGRVPPNFIVMYSYYIAINSTIGGGTMYYVVSWIPEPYVFSNFFCKSMLPGPLYYCVFHKAFWLLPCNVTPRFVAMIIAISPLGPQYI